MIGQERGKVNLTTVGKPELGDGNAFHSILLYKSGKKKGKVRGTYQSHKQALQERTFNERQALRVAKKMNIPDDWTEWSSSKYPYINDRDFSELLFDAEHDAMAEVMKGKAKGY